MVGSPFHRCVIPRLVLTPSVKQFSTTGSHEPFSGFASRRLDLIPWSGPSRDRTEGQRENGTDLLAHFVVFFSS
jgi:hypothetical protein